MRKKNVLKTLISLILIFIPIITFASERDLKNVESILVKQEWNKVSEILKSVNTKTNSPVLRLIKAHADLALNKNNESLCLFLSVISEEELKRWNKWTENFLKRHPKSAVAYYLRGDALARLEKLDAALEAFNKALEIEPENALVLNARGIVYATKGDVDRARLDFYKASKKAKAPLADAYCNLGFLNIQKKDGAEGAINHFTRALEISPDFALAFHGRGLVRLVLNDKENIKKAKKDLKLGIEKACCDVVKNLMLHNEVRYAARISGINFNKLMVEAKNAGTTFSKKYEELAASADMWGKLSKTLRENKWIPFNQYLANFAGNRHVERMEAIYQEFGIKKIDKFYIQHPEIKSYSLNEINRVGTYNEKIQPAERRLEFTFNVVTAIGGFLARGGDGPEIGDVISVVGTIGSAITDLTEDWSQIHSDFANQIKGRYQPFMNHSITTPANFPGGVEISMAEINWDEGYWPFKEYYGLFYGLKSKKLLLTSELKGKQNEYKN